MTLTPNLRGATYMMASMAAFSLSDACVKFVVEDLPLFQMIFLRGISTTLLMLGIMRGMGVLDFRIPRGDLGRVTLRTVAEVGAMVPFLIALTNMPFANVVAIMAALPLVVTLAGAVFLGEQVGWRRWGAILVGFFGVILIVQPGGDGFTGYALVALLAVVGITIRDIVTRRLSAAVPSMTVALFTAVSVCLFGGVLSLAEPWQPLNVSSTILMLSASVFIIGGYVFSVLVMRVGEIGFVAPFRYTSLIWALGLGYLVFGEWPNTLALIGSLIVVSTGVFTLYRERVVIHRSG
jgi:S-adenosylmethionine uptake transporter